MNLEDTNMPDAENGDLTGGIFDPKVGTFVPVRTCMLSSHRLLQQPWGACESAHGLAVQHQCSCSCEH